jgi:hypothetical protein
VLLAQRLELPGALLGEPKPDDALAVGIGPALDQAGRSRAVHEADGAVVAEQEAVATSPIVVRADPLAADREQQLVLRRREARFLARRSLQRRKRRRPVRRQLRRRGPMSSGWGPVSIGMPDREP